MKRLMLVLAVISCVAPASASARRHRHVEIHAVKSDRQLEALTGGALMPNTEVGTVAY